VSIEKIEHDKIENDKMPPAFELGSFESECSRLAVLLDALEIEKLNEQRKKWLARIKEYETECVEDMEATRGILIESIKNTKQWAQKMRESPGNNELEEQSIDEHLRKLKTFRHELKGFQFGGRMMMFNEGNPSSRIRGYSDGFLAMKRLRVPRLLESYYMQQKQSLLSCIFISL
jgi:hypothetical protein